jgi:hydroxyacylglutathione hydrolase
MNSLVGRWSEGAIWRTTSGIFSSNSYFYEIGCLREGILIDPGLDGPAIDAALIRNKQTPIAIVCTHGHFDHAGSADYFQKKYGVNIYLPKRDARIFRSSNFLLSAFKIPVKISLPDHIDYIDSGSNLCIRNLPIYFRDTPGHTPGSCIIEINNAWFTGDTLYAQGIGLSKLPGEDHRQLKSSLLGLWTDLTEQITIYPGHGDPANGAMVKIENRALIKFLATRTTQDSGSSEWIC